MLASQRKRARERERERETMKPLLFASEEEDRSLFLLCRIDREWLELILVL